MEALRCCEQQSDDVVCTWLRAGEERCMIRKSVHIVAEQAHLKAVQRGFFVMLVGSNFAWR
jgi:hypothetical protein